MCRAGLASMPAYDRISRARTEHNLRKHLWVLLVFIALSLVLTWPLAAHFATHVPGDGIDDPSLAWNLWWAKHGCLSSTRRIPSWLTGNFGRLASTWPSTH